jgi:seryl-tRNA synthetase
MHDIKAIRENPAAFDAALARRGLPAQAAELVKLDEAKRGGQTELQNLQARRNEVAKAIGVAMREDKAKAEALKAEVGLLRRKGGHVYVPPQPPN